MNFFSEFFARRKMRGASGTIRRMFFERAEKHAVATTNILNKMPGALQAIADLIEEKETFKKGGILEWGEISLVAADTEDALIILVGIIRFPPGAEVELSTGEKVKVTPETVQYFPPRIIRIGLPLNMAEATKDEIKTYLKKTVEEQKADIEEMKNTLQEALDGQEDEASEVPVKTIKKQEPIATAADFDLTQLTEEQRRQLQLLSQKTGRG